MLFLIGGRNSADCRHALDQAKILNVEEEKRLFPDDWAADAAAKLVLAQFRLRADRSKIILGIELVIPKELIQGPMEGVGAGLGDQVDHAAAGARDFGRVEVGKDLDFFDRIDRRPDANA